jgi:glycosyltransferase involved in cell wall biosynthesis
MNSPDVVVLKEPTEELSHRCLLISAAFPPSSAVGALRWQKFVGQLHASGWAFDVVTKHPEEAESVDMSRLAALPASTRVMAVRSHRLQPFRFVFETHRRLSNHRASKRDDSSEPGQVAALPASSAPVLVRTNEIRRIPRSVLELRRVYRGWLDREAEREWSESVLRALRSRNGSNYAAVLSSGPPNLAHVTAAKLAEQAKKPFVMDMRDPWGTAVAYSGEGASPLEVGFARRMESFCASRAAAVLVNTPLARVLFSNAHPAAAPRCHVIMNGTDDDVDIVTVAPRKKFIIAFAGSIYIDRNPRLIFRAAAKVIKEFGLTADQFGFEFIGSVFEYGGVTTKRIAEEEGIADYVELTSFIPRDKLLKRLLQASMLLSLPQDVETSIPAKIFEYMSFPAWLLVLAPERSATYDLLAESGADVVAPTDVGAIEARIRSRFLEFRDGVNPEPISASGLFTRARQTAKLQQVLDEVTTSSPSSFNA